MLTLQKSVLPSDTPPPPPPTQQYQIKLNPEQMYCKNIH